MAGTQVTGNVGMYYAAYRLSQMGWNVMPTSRNARGIDLLVYDVDAKLKLGIQVKTLSKRSAVPLGIKGVEGLMGDWWVIVASVATKQECFILRPEEVKQLAVRDKGGAQAFWLPANSYTAEEFREAWDRIGRGDINEGRNDT